MFRICAPGAEYGRILVGRSYNFKPSAVRYQPGVAGTEDGQSGLFKTGLKIFRTTELAGHLLEETEGEYSSFFRKAGAALRTAAFPGEQAVLRQGFMLSK